MTSVIGSSPDCFSASRRAWISACRLCWPAVFTATRHLAGTPTIELTIHLRSTTPVRGPILGRFTTRTIDEGHLDDTGQLWSTTRQLLAESRQLALLIEPPPAKDR